METRESMGSSSSDVLKNLAAGSVQADVTPVMAPTEQPTENFLAGLLQEEAPASQESEVEDSKPAEAEISEAKESEPEGDSVDYFTYTDASGVKRRGKIDYNDRKMIKKRHEEAMGMRKSMAETQKLRQKLSGIESEYNKIKPVWDDLESAYAIEGPIGVVSKLPGGVEKLNELIDKKVQQKLRKQAALSEEEITMIEREERLEEQLRQIELREKRLQDEAEKRKSKEAVTEEKEILAMLTPSYIKYSFAGKLGNKDREEKFNKYLWQDAYAELASLDEDLSPALVERVFRKHSALINGSISEEVDKKVSQKLKQRKVQTAKSVQNAAKQGISSNGTGQKELDTALKTGSSSKILEALYKLKKGK